MKEALQMIQITSNPNNITVVETLVSSIVTSHNLNADKHGDILISLTEAVNNAIFHGNKCDTKKNVCISYKETRKNLFFRISDEGKGFNPAILSDPTTEENLYSIGGRGVFIMNQLTDKLIYKDNGRTVELCFNI